MFTPSETVGVAEGIIDDTCLIRIIFSFRSLLRATRGNPWRSSGPRRFAWRTNVRKWAGGCWVTWTPRKTRARASTISHAVDGWRETRLHPAGWYTQSCPRWEMIWMRHWEVKIGLKLIHPADPRHSRICDPCFRKCCLCKHFKTFQVFARGVIMDLI